MRDCSRPVRGHSSFRHHNHGGHHSAQGCWLFLDPRSSPESFVFVAHWQSQFLSYLTACTQLSTTCLSRREYCPRSFTLLIMPINIHANTLQNASDINLAVNDPVVDVLLFMLVSSPQHFQNNFKNSFQAAKDADDPLRIRLHGKVQRGCTALIQQSHCVCRPANQILHRLYTPINTPTSIVEPESQQYLPPKQTRQCPDAAPTLMSGE